MEYHYEISIWKVLQLIHFQSKTLQTFIVKQECQFELDFFFLENTNIILNLKKLHELWI